MSKFLINVVLLLCFSTAALAQTGEWKKYTVKGDEFSIALPVVPAMTSYDKYLRGSSRLECVLGAYSDGVVYSILSFESKEENGLTAFIEERIGLSEFQIAQPGRDVTVGGMKGREFDVTQPQAPGVIRFLPTKNHVYQMLAVGAAVGDPRMQKFFSSFSIDKKVKAIEVVDGAGAADDKRVKSPQLNLDRAYVARDVDRKAIVVSKPEPVYTIDAKRNEIKGRVLMRGVLSANGEVLNVRVMEGLPMGLSDTAMDAAKQIRFIPALKDGRYVSMTFELEYDFSLR